MSLAGLVLLAACTQLPDILEAEPVRSAAFKGSHVAMATCVQQSIHGGKVQRAPDGSKIDIYDAKKSWDWIGVSHYAVSVYENGQVELRKLPAGDLTEQAGQRLWTPVEGCIQRASAS